MEDILPAYLAIGVSYERFMAACPNDLKPFELAYTKRIKMRDSEMFAMSRYVYEAMLCAVDNALRGRESKLTFRTQSFMEEAEEEKRLTIKKQEELLYNGLNAMKLRFEIAKSHKEVIYDASSRRG